MGATTIKKDTRQLKQTWKKLIMVSNTKKQGKMIAHITPLRVDQDVPAKHKQNHCCRKLNCQFTNPVRILQ